MFYQALNGTTVFSGLGFGLLMYSVLSLFGLPVLLIYDVVRGRQSTPHGLILEVAGAFLGRYFFLKNKDLCGDNTHRCFSQVFPVACLPWVLFLL